MDMKNNFSINIKNLMLEKEYTTQTLADELGYSQSAVSKWINGKKEPGIIVVIKIAKLFGCAVEELFYN